MSVFKRYAIANVKKIQKIDISEIVPYFQTRESMNFTSDSIALAVLVLLLKLRKEL